MRTFGTDPEFMLGKDGEIHSAIGIVHGSIDNRITIDGHQFYFDNVLAECAIKPASSKEEALNNIREALKIYTEMVAPYELVLRSSHDFTLEQLDNDDARRAGCAPDWCVYRMKQIAPPKQEIKNGQLRTCGGHVHLGAEVLRIDGPQQVYSIFMMDLLLGTTSLWLDNDPTSARRRELYGQAGRYRVAGPEDNPYGVEYRSLGNFWFKSPKHTSLVYDLAMLAVDWSEDGTAEQLWDFDLDLFLDLQDDFHRAYTPKYDVEKLKAAINTSDKDLAQPFLELIYDMVPKEITQRLDETIGMKTRSLNKEWKLS